MSRKYKIPKKKGSFLKDGLSIDETRFSLIAFLLVTGSGFAFYQVVRDKDIADNLLTFLGYLIAAIAGVNITESITKGINKNKKIEKAEETIEYDDQI